MKDYDEYTARDAELLKANKEGKISDATLDELRKQSSQGYFQPKADLNQFETLLGKLEASKIKQAGSAALDTRRNTYAQGLAQMMSNF
jgi:hypothetical protein